MLEHYVGLEEILKVIDILSEKQGNERLEEKYKIRATLIPLWKNYISIYVDRFNRYKEMADHGSIHISNLITLAADLFAPLSYKDFKKKNYIDFPLNAEELFILLAGIFLHDIGMADVKKATQELHEIRNTHGKLSYDILIASGVSRDDPENLLPTLNEEEKELIALICQHHQKKAPLDKYDQIELIKNKKTPFKDMRCLKKKYPQGAKFNGLEVNPVLIASLLRLLDACDTQYSRAGSIWLSRKQLDNNKRLLVETEREIGKLEDWLSRKECSNNGATDKSEELDENKKY